MYELVQVAENTYYINSPSKIGVYRVSDDDVWLIDSGNDKDAGRKIQKILDAQGWKLTAIINTHSNADHVGGNTLLQNRLNCAVYSTPMENIVTENPILESTFLYGGYPFKKLRSKFLMATPSNTQDIATAKRTSVVMSRHSIVKEERIDMRKEWMEQMRYYGHTRQYYPTDTKCFISRELGSRALFFIATIAIIAILPLELKLGAIGLILMRYAIVVWSSRRVAHKLGVRDIALKYWIYDLFGPALEWMLWSKKSHNTPRIWK
jgi:hypothetical protein